MRIELDQDGFPRGGPRRGVAAVLRRRPPEELRLPDPADWAPGAGERRCGAALRAAVAAGVPVVRIGGVAFEATRSRDAAMLALLASRTAPVSSGQAKATVPAGIRPVASARCDAATRSRSRPRTRSTSTGAADTVGGSGPDPVADSAPGAGGPRRRAVIRPLPRR